MQEVATQQNGALTAYAPQVETILASDVLIPRLLLMQGLSEFVSQRKAQQGDYVKTGTMEKVGGMDAPFEIIPLTFTTQWRIMKQLNGKWVFAYNEPRGAKNDGRREDFTVEGVLHRPLKEIGVYVLLASDIKAEEESRKRYKETGELPDLDKTVLPALMSFRVTQYKGGQAIVTYFSKAAAQGAQMHHYSLKVTCRMDKNDKGTFFVPEISMGRPLTKAEREVTDKLALQVRSQMHMFKVAEEEDDVPISSAPHAQSEF